MAWETTLVVWSETEPFLDRFEELLQEEMPDCAVVAFDIEEV
jgi:hypothetical protein